MTRIEVDVVETMVAVEAECVVDKLHGRDKAIEVVKYIEYENHKYF